MFEECMLPELFSHRTPPSHNTYGSSNSAQITVSRQAKLIVCKTNMPIDFTGYMYAHAMIKS